MNPETQGPTPVAKWLCTLCALLLGALGAAAITTETHRGFARFKGHVTLLGDSAVAMGFVLLCMALLPLVVWIPRRWIGRALVVWWLLLMTTIFQGVFQPF